MASAVGLLGSVPFVCSSAMVMTFRNLQIERSMRWATHEVIGQKPMLERIGPELTTVSFEVQLNSLLGMPPALGIRLFRQMIERGEAQRLLIGPDYLGKFVIESMYESQPYHTGFGIPVVATVSLSLKEAR